MSNCVTGDTPILLKNIETNEVLIQHIEDIVSKNLQVWSENNWTDIKNITSHKIDKKFYRIITDIGCVDIINVEKQKPLEAKVGTELLHTFPKTFPENKETIIKFEKESDETFKCKECNIIKGTEYFYKNNKMKNGHLSICKQCMYYKNSTRQVRKITNSFEIKDYILSENEAKCWGFFHKNGFCESYTCNSGIKNCWSITTDNYDEINYFKNLLEKIEPIEFKITNMSNGTYKLAPVGNVKYMVNKYIKLFYTSNPHGKISKYKIVPNCILNGLKTIKLAFLDGARSKDTDKFITRGKIGTMGIYYLLKSIEIKKHIEITNDYLSKPETYILQLNENNIPNKTIKKITKKSMKLNDCRYYTIETVSGKFHAGIGELIITNT